jgi:hypothetical protein
MSKAFQFLRPRVEDFSTDPRESREVDKEMKANLEVSSVFFANLGIGWMMNGLKHGKTI